MTAAQEQRNLLAATVDKLFRDLTENAWPHTGTRDLDQCGLPAQLWQPIEDNGIASVMVPERAGGFGGTWEDAFVVLNSAGFYAVPLPIAETLLAQHLLAQADIALPAGPIAIAADTDIELRADGTLHGTAGAVPWANAATSIAVVCQRDNLPHIALATANVATAARSGRSIAGEPVADLRFQGAPSMGAGALAADVFALCALLRTVQIAGALNAALRLSVQYANERSQFGKPIGKFQAIQHALALLADEAAAVNCAALAACRAAAMGAADFEIAAAKLRANRAVGAATSIAHQVHGAIGFTREHKLHEATQRLWSWRSDFGNDRYWATRLGAQVAQRGADHLWADLTARGDRSAASA